jgi:hypothetical protein
MGGTFERRCGWRGRGEKRLRVWDIESPSITVGVAATDLPSDTSIQFSTSW